MTTNSGSEGRGTRAFTIAELLVGIIIVAFCVGIVVISLNSGNKHDKP